MTYIEFIEECSNRSIEPSIAFENENLRSALTDGNDEKAKEILDNEF